MTQEPIDYEAVLADLHARRTALDAAIAAIEQLQNHSAQTGASGVSAGGGKVLDPASVPDDAFFGLSIGDAAKKYLGMVKRKQSVREISEALDRGGLPHTSSNFMNTVGTMLNRAANTDQELVRVGRGEWGLAGWYGNRRPKPESAKKNRHGKRRGRKAMSGGNPSPGPVPDDSQKGRKQLVANNQSSATIRQLAEHTIRAAGKPLHITEIVERIGAETGRKVKKDTLGGLFSIAVRKSDTFTKVAPGVFGLIAKQ